MNSVTWILIGESFLILVSLVVAIAVYAWRKKRRLLAALDDLLTNLSKAEPERKTTLTERLKNYCQIEEAKANLLSDEIFAAEHQFIQQLIQLLLSPETDKIAGFNEDIYALVTPYWELLSLDRVADGLSVEQSADGAATPPVSSESDGLPSEDYYSDVSVAAAEDLETESTSTLTEPNSDIKIDEDDVVVSSAAADQSTPTQDPNESGQSEETNQLTSVSPAEGLSTGIVEDEDLTEETTDSVEAEEDEPSWDEAFDEAAQAQESKAINLDENDDAEGKSKKVPEL